ncbi:MAG: DUF6290 family protein [Bacillota bacterium]|nr:DUF6290 family protein [Bacillota bacterium]NLP22408.1 antitoxin [Erysipelotrichaceae bacterium]
MGMITLRVSEDEEKLIKEYVSINNLNLSSFIRELVLDKIEEDLCLNEERILEAVNNARKERMIDSKEVWDKLVI